MMKKVLCLLLALVLTLTVFAGCTKTPSNDPEKLTKLNVAYHTNLGGAAIVCIGNEQGIWEKYGFELNLVGFTSGPVEIAAMLSGELDYGFIGHGAHTLAIDGKVDVLAYEKMGDDEEIITSTDTGIKTLADLKGKKIGTTLGTSGETVLRAALKEAGLTDKDVSIVNMDMGACVVAMVSGQIDAVCVFAQYKNSVKDQLGSKAVSLATTSSFAELVSPSSWIATPEYITRNHEQSVRFCAAIIECIDYFAGHRDETAKYVADFLKLDYEAVRESAQSITLLTIDEYEAALNSGKIDTIYKLQQENFLEQGKISGPAETDTYVRFDIMKEAIELIKANKAN